MPTSSQLFRRCFAFLLGALLLVRPPAVAQTCLDNFALVGTAQQTGGYYQLTRQGENFTVGGIWSANTIDLTADFDLSFNVYQCGAADGVVFVLHQGGPYASSGRWGGSLGYYDEPNNNFARSLAVEFDIYDNGSLTPSYFDSDNSHVALVAGGVPQPVRGPYPIRPALSACRDRLLRVQWTAASQVFTVDLDGVRLISYTRDLVASLFAGNPHVTFGFVGSTGGQTATQNITPLTLIAGNPSATIAASGSTTFCGPGRVTLNAGAGQPAGSTYEWSPAVGLSATTTAAVVAEPAVTTTYLVTVTTPGGCVSRGDVTITVSPPLTVAAGPPPAITCPGSPVQLTAASVGGSGTPSYYWSPTTGLNTALGDTVLATPAVTTLYTVLVITPNGCIARDTVRVVVRPPVPVAVGPTQTIRPGATATLSVATPLPGVTYAWSPAAGLNSTAGSLVLASPDSSTTYTVTATDAAGCTGQATVRVELNTVLRVSTAPGFVICPGVGVALTATSDGTRTQYTWTPAVGLSATTGDTVFAAPAVLTTYTVTGVDSAGYTGQATVTVRPVVPPAFAPQARITSVAMRQVRFRADASGAPITSYAWDFGDGSAPSTEAAPVHTYPQAGTYAARLTVGYGLDCTAEATLALTLPDFVLPNVITPDGDGRNDAFAPVVSADPVVLRVYNRWGRLVFEQADYPGTWGTDVAAGTYYYYLSTAVGESWKGWVEVVR